MASDPNRKTRRTTRPFTRAGRKMDTAFGEAADRMEADLKDVIKYLNDEVVPQVRDHSSKALRVAARELARLADYMDDRRRR